MADTSEVYEDMFSDYLSAYGFTPDPPRPLPRGQAQRTICAALGTKGVSAFEEARQGVSLPPAVPTECIGAEKQGLSFGRFYWELSRLSSGEILATRSATVDWPYGLMFLGQAITTEERDGLVVTTVTDQMWDCPLNPDDPCASFPVEGTDSHEARCIVDQRTPCTKGEFASEVHVVEVSGKRSLRFGSFQYRPPPRVIVTSDAVTVEADDCVQTATRPWGAGR